jgi:hypothetical protein
MSGIQSVDELTVTASGDRDIDDHGNVLIDEMALFSLVDRDLEVTPQSRGTQVHQ